MRGRPSAAHIVVIHARQVVMNERIPMNYLGRCRDAGCVPRSTGGTVCGKDEHSPHSLAAV
jgi:hypothetical protein